MPMAARTALSEPYAHDGNDSYPAGVLPDFGIAFGNFGIGAV